MVPSKRFKPVLRIAESRERTAAHRFGDSQRKVQEQEAKLDELRRYHQEYLDRFNAASRNGMSAAQLREYQAFLAKLDQAIQEQENIVHASDADCTVSKKEWQNKHIRSKVLDNVMSRCEMEERRHKDKLEQKEVDERSQSSVFRRPSR
ncbi:hypothetical protein MNBD_GAMMA26-594 [hydrothermal vent metagenome]|uniref:Flagellar FliJ protein n=1 Tax=hydrothermal vent metagenome TaxID=652676 RepID=A0A3B1B1N8_9ZZZZ